MWSFYGLLIFVCISHYVCNAYYENYTPIDICTICKCNTKEPSLDCRQLNLYMGFDDREWYTRNSSYLAALKKIEFDYNYIEVVIRFPKLPNVRYLSFRSNKIHSIQSLAFYNLTALEWLDLSDNELTSETLQKENFEGHFDPRDLLALKNLKWLNLVNNELYTLKEDVFDHLYNLETLLLGQNPFKFIDPNAAYAISSLNKLRVLDLSYMELRTLPENMLHPLRSLHTLNLTGNLFTSLPAEALSFAPNLVHLNLNDNPFVHIGGEYTQNNFLVMFPTCQIFRHSFPPLPKLETLSLSHSHTLQTIDEGAFHNLTALQFFTCVGNRRLNKIHPNAFRKFENSSKTRWPLIRSIILSRNNLSSISEDMFKFWHEIDEIDIRYNPWQCTCENQWMIDKLIPIIKEKSKKNPSIYEDLECSSPDEMKSKKLAELSSRGVYMKCVDSRTELEQRKGSTPMGFFIGIMVGIAMTLTVIYIYRSGCFGILGYRTYRYSPNEDGRKFFRRSKLDEYLTDK